MKKVQGLVLFMALFGLEYLTVPTTYAQQYASGVIAFSSQYSPLSWSAEQALGPPNTYPNYGDISTAWASQSADLQREFLELLFSNPEIINEVWVYETFNPGALDTIYVRYTGSSSWIKVWDTTAATLPAQSIIRKAKFNITPFAVDAVRLAINSPAVIGWNEIDAVAIYLNLSTGVTPSANKPTFQVFPNPSRQFFSIISPQRDTYFLFDLTGRQVDVFTAEDEFTYRHQLQPGFYWLKSASGHTEKMMILE